MRTWTALAATLLMSAAAAQLPHKNPDPAASKAKPATDRTSGLAQAWLRSLTLREQAAQLVMIPFYGEAPGARTRQYRDFVHAVRDLRVGGLILVNRVQHGSVRNAEPYAMAAFLNRMQRLAKVPLIVGADFERGASMRVSGTTKFPHLMAYGAAGDMAATRRLGAATAREARALGVHWVFAPDADVNNNPDNPIINIRSFGADPQMVAAHVKAFIEGVHEDTKNRVLATAKHFPGHGDVAVDSHLGMPRLEVDRARLNAVELVPFRAAIDAGVDAVMTAHMAVPALEPETVPATVSGAVLTGVLRREMNFHGLVVTDAMDMLGLSKQFSPGEAAVRAIEAGADLLLMPSKPDEAVRAVVAAVGQGRLTRKRLQESVARVLAAKVSVGLSTGKKLVDLEAISDLIDSPEADEQAQQVADQAVTLVKNDRNLLPLAHPENACYLVLAENRYSQQGRRFLDDLHSRFPQARNFLLDGGMADIELTGTIQKASDCGVCVVAAFVSVASYRGDLALPGGFAPMLSTLINGPAPVVLIALGNPYLLRSFPGVAAYLATFSTAPTSESAAVHALNGEIAIRGHLPVSIPGIARYGEGLQLPAAHKAVP